MLYLEIPQRKPQRKSWTLGVLNASIQSHQDFGGFDKTDERTPIRAHRSEHTDERNRIAEPKWDSQGVGPRDPIFGDSPTSAGNLRIERIGIDGPLLAQLRLRGRKPRGVDLRASFALLGLGRLELGPENRSALARRWQVLGDRRFAPSALRTEPSGPENPSRTDHRDPYGQRFRLGMGARPSLAKPSRRCADHSGQGSRGPFCSSAAIGSRAGWGTRYTS